MSNGVEGHVDGGVRERFNEELGIPRESRTLTEVSGDSPFLEPINSFFESLQNTLVVCVEVAGLNVLFNALLPVGFTVFNVPLVAEGNNTDL